MLVTERGIRIKLVDVQRLSRSTAVIAECDFAEAADFTDDIDGFRPYDIYLVSRMVGLS